MYAWCSPFGLLNVSQAGLEPASGSTAALLFSHVTWHGEAFQGLEVQGVEVLIFLDALFPPSVAPASQQGLESWSSCCLLLCPIHHLGSLDYGVLWQLKSTNTAPEKLS
jgi:hypothetical protein